jgi:thymidylate synthase (FAD)
MTRDELIAKFGKPIPVLDHGFVRVIDIMGDDDAVVQAARISTGAGTKTPEEDRNLIRYLLRMGHSSPFEMASIKLHIKLPIVSMRQLVRHRVAKLNEQSGRYSVLPDEMYLPAPEVIASQSATNRQGREIGEVDQDYAQEFLDTVSATQKLIRAEYEVLIDKGYARELARLNLPVAQYTECYWKMDLRDLLHFSHLRMDSHAQYEIRVYANAIAEIVKAWVPLTWEAFEDYVLGAVTFSKPEMELIKKLADSDLGHYSDFNHRLSKREFQEFCAKLPLIGYDPAEYFPATPDHAVPG